MGHGYPLYSYILVYRYMFFAFHSYIVLGATNISNSFFCLSEFCSIRVNSVTEKRVSNLWREQKRVGVLRKGWLILLLTIRTDRQITVSLRCPIHCTKQDIQVFEFNTYQFVFSFNVNTSISCTVFCCFKHVWNEQL